VLTAASAEEASIFCATIVRNWFWQISNCPAWMVWR